MYKTEQTYRYVYVKEKSTCPRCNYNTYQRYIDLLTGKLLDSKYGKCERVNSCCYNVKPDTLYIDIDDICEDLEDEYQCDAVNRYDLYDINMQASKILGNEHNSFIDNDIDIPEVFLMRLKLKFGISSVNKANIDYCLGSFWDSGVLFPYYFKGNLINSKIIWYKADLHRDKDNSIQWLHNAYYKNGIKNGYYENDYYMGVYDYKYKTTLPLFGWDLVDKYPDKKICIVESEKTAFICSIVMPEYVWLATGQLQTLKSYRFPYATQRQFFIFPDMCTCEPGKHYTDYWQQQANIIAYDCPPFKHSVIDYVPPCELMDQKYITVANQNGYDIADFILNAEGLKIDLQEYVKHIKLKISAN